MGLDIRHLVSAFFILACLGTSGLSQTPEATVPPPGGSATDGSMQVPGIFVYPPLPRAQPRGAHSGDGSQNAAPDEDASEGCRYVPRKLDLIV